MNWTVMLRQIREAKRPDLNNADRAMQHAFEYGYLEAIVGYMYEFLSPAQKKVICELFFSDVKKETD